MSASDASKAANQMWGGRFAEGPDAIMQAINASIGFDKRLYAQDIAGSRAHAAMLAATGILTDSDAQAIGEGLLTVLSEIEGGTFQFKVELEDIHLNVESRLTEIVGEAGKRLHTGRSRNDQVAVDFRLWVRDQCDAAIAGLTGLMRAFVAQAEAGADWVMPGFTHLQTAQPVTWGHHMMAYVEMFARSRFAEELVIWSSAQFRFVRLSDKWTTGSSIMPQKKNPDAAELLRAKLGRILGATVALFTVMKGLALTYSKDMQEDKEQVFDAADSLMLGLAAMTGMVGDMTANRDVLKAAAASGFSTATDLADWLVREAGLPFREAHHVTGALVALAEKKGCDLPELSLQEMTAVHPGINQSVFAVLGVENSVRSRMSYGGTAPDQVRAQVARWKSALDSAQG